MRISDWSSDVCSSDLQAYYEVVEKMPGGYHDGYLAFWGRYLRADGSFCRDGQCLLLPTWNHLWFVAYLWVYTVVLWAFLRIAPWGLARVRERLGGLLSGAGLLVWPVLVLARLRLALFGRFGSTHALVPPTGRACCGGQVCQCGLIPVV